jgi:hypothetical protein
MEVGSRADCQPPDRFGLSLLPFLVEPPAVLGFKHGRGAVGRVDAEHSKLTRLHELERRAVQLRSERREGVEVVSI